MFYTFLPLPDHFPAIQQPEGVKKEFTQSSLICTKGKASLFILSREIGDLLHYFVGFVLQNQRPFQGRKEGLRVKVLGYNSVFSEISLTHWAILCSSFITQTADPNSHCSNAHKVKTSGKKKILTIPVVTFSHQAQRFLNQSLSACQETWCRDQPELIFLSLVSLALRLKTKVNGIPLVLHQVSPCIHTHS